MKKILNSSWFFWAILAFPSIPMMITLAQGEDVHRLLHPTGEFSARFMIIAMMLTPLMLLFKQRNWNSGWILWLMRRRRALGVAAFGYGLLHTLLYLVDMGELQAVLAEFWELGIWTGWVAFAIFIPLAITSNQASVMALGKKWKTLQRFVYAAAVLTLIHWFMVSHSPAAAIGNFVPLAALELYRVIHVLKQRKTGVA